MKKAKRYQTGGVLRDRFGNPVRSGSGDVVRTTYPERSYDEQASASMTESSDYSGRRPRTSETTESKTTSSQTMPDLKFKPSDIGFTGGYEDVTNESSYSPRSTYKSEDIGDAKNDDIKPKPKPKPKPRKRVSQSFGETDSDALNRRRLEGLKKDTPYGKSERLKALAETFSPERRSKRYAESTPYARSKMGMKSGGKVSSASSRADGIAQRGKTKGKMV
jgi:hypothetical protein